MEDERIKDIYSGECLGVWRDGDLVHMCFYGNACTVSFTDDEWGRVKDEMLGMFAEIGYEIR